MRTAFDGFVAPFSPTVTSVMHGTHVEGSAHYAGRAVDVGAFNGQSVGMNRETLYAIVAAMASGRFEAIGTIKPIADAPEMQALAQRYGVRLFEDEGTGPHVHFQVAG